MHYHKVLLKVIFICISLIYCLAVFGNSTKTQGQKTQRKSSRPPSAQAHFKDCPVCNGKGMKTNYVNTSKEVRCPNCYGSGRAISPRTGQFDRCGLCKGRGLWMEDSGYYTNNICTNCNGTGKIEVFKYKGLLLTKAEIEAKEAAIKEINEARNIILNNKTKTAKLPRSITNSINMELVLIKPGEFMMGAISPDEFNPRQHQKFILNAYYIGKHEVTVKQWKSVMNDIPGRLTAHVVVELNRGIQRGKEDDHPVTFVSWDDTQKFCAKLSAITGDKYRLPSEAEWEYAARGGTETDYYFGDDPSLLSDHAWFQDNANGYPHSVGQKKPNLYGLFDMYGNVGELCQDQSHYLFTYNGAPRDQRPWEKEYILSSQVTRILRGGAWHSPSINCRSTNRSWAQPDYKGPSVGFRVVRDVQ